MIRPLRFIHRLAWTVLGVALPAILFAALLARHPIAPEPHAASSVGSNRLSRSGKFKVRREGKALFITAARPFDYPDVLAYWSVDSKTVSDKSKLLGTFDVDSVNRYEIESDTGNIVLYTLAKRAIIDSAPLGGSQ